MKLKKSLICFSLLLFSATLLYSVDSSSNSYPTYGSVMEHWEEAENAYQNEEWKKAIAQYALFIKDGTKIMEVLDAASSPWYDRSAYVIRNDYTQNTFAQFKVEKNKWRVLYDNIQTVPKKTGICCMNSGMYNEAIEIFISLLKKSTIEKSDYEDYIEIRSYVFKMIDFEFGATLERK